MTKTMTIEEAIAQLTATKPHQLNTPETMALAAAMLLKGPIYLSGLMQSVPEGFLLSDTTANSALKSLEEGKITEDYWEKTEGKGRPRRMYKLADGADVGPIAALNVCGGAVGGSIDAS